MPQLLPFSFIGNFLSWTVLLFLSYNFLLLSVYPVFTVLYASRSFLIRTNSHPDLVTFSLKQFLDRLLRLGLEAKTDLLPQNQSPENRSPKGDLSKKDSSKKGFKVVVTNVNDGREVSFPSVGRAAKKMKISPITLNKYANTERAFKGFSYSVKRSQ